MPSLKISTTRPWNELTSSWNFICRMRNVPGNAPARKKLARLQNRRNLLSFHLPMAAFAPLIGKNLGMFHAAGGVRLAPLLKHNRTFRCTPAISRTKVAEKRQKRNGKTCAQADFRARRKAMLKTIATQTNAKRLRMRPGCQSSA